jgi:hypothetical protein
MQDTTLWGSGVARLRPPEGFSAAEKKAFLDLVTSCPQQQFEASDIPLIARWAELEFQAQTAAAELRAHGMVTADGKPSVWLSIHAMAVKGQALLALRLRLGPQSRAPRAPKTRPAPVSIYERMSLEDDDAKEVGGPSAS